MSKMFEATQEMLNAKSDPDSSRMFAASQKALDAKSDMDAARRASVYQSVMPRGAVAPEYDALDAKPGLDSSPRFSPRRIAIGGEGPDASERFSSVFQRTQEILNAKSEQRASVFQSVYSGADVNPAELPKTSFDDYMRDVAGRAAADSKSFDVAKPDRANRAFGPHLPFDSGAIDVKPMPTRGRDMSDIDAAVGNLSQSEGDSLELQ